ncbi:MAG: sigma 54-interacting transcriptional regulator [bacterium]
MSKKKELDVIQSLPDVIFEKKINKLKLVHYISVEMNKSHSTKALLTLILERCLELTGAKTGSVMLIDEKEQVLDIVAFKNLPSKTAGNTRLKLGEGVTGWVAQSGNPKLINNTRQDPLYVKVREDLLSELVVPIKTENKVIGVISVDSNKANAFTEDDLELLIMVAELAAQIIIKDQMQEKLGSKIRSQEILIDTFHVIEQEESLNEVFNKVMEIMKEKMGILRGMLLLFDSEKTDSLKIYSGYRISEDAIKKGVYKIGEGIIGNVVLKGQTIAVEDISKEPTFLNKLKINRTAKNSIIAAPIKAGPRVLGVLEIEKVFNESESFQDGVYTITLLASLIAYRVRSFQRQQEETQKLVSENIELKIELKKENNFKNIVGKNEQMRRIMEQVKTVSNTNVPVLITGETGTGKELIAKIVHFLSDRRDNKFISVNCSAIPENLIESELFGYEKGAFTGAVGNKKGKFELADKGTLFLDEIGEMPLQLQSKILRAIQEKEIEPLGSEKSIKVDIRIIAATNKDLKNLVAEGKFRADLYFRLNVINVHMPALRERKDDLPLLVDFFIKRYNDVYKKQVAGMDKAAEEIVNTYAWPGNIRELENVIERAVIMSKGSIIDASLFPDNINPSQNKDEGFNINEYIKTEARKKIDGSIYKEVIGALEKRLIEDLLVETGNNKVKTSQKLGINRNTLKAKMRDYGLI